MSNFEKAFTLSPHGGFATQHEVSDLWAAFTNLLSQDKLPVPSFAAAKSSNHCSSAA